MTVPIARTFLVSLAAAAAVLALAAPAAAQGRVSGISVMVTDVRPNGTGREVDFDVQLTTTRGEGCCPTPYFFGSPDGGYLGDVSFATTFTGTETYGPFSTSTFSSTTPYGGGTLIYRGTYFYYSTVRGNATLRLVADGAMPAIDYGDGQTVPAATLPTLASSATTSGGGVRRVFRGSFTHMYGDRTTPHTLRVASACCPGTTTSEPPHTGEIATAAAYPMRIAFELAASITGSYRGVSSYRTLYHSPGSETTVLASTGPVTGIGPYSFTSYVTSTATSTTLSTLGFPVQLFNTAQIAALSITEIPTASTWSLLALAGLLAGAGALLLRRG